MTYRRRAVVEPPGPDLSPEALVELGTAQLRARAGEGHATLRGAGERASDPVAAAGIALAVSRGARSVGSHGRAEEIVVGAIAAVGDAEPELLADLALTRRIGTAAGRPSAARVAELADAARARAARSPSCSCGSRRWTRRPCQRPRGRRVRSGAGRGGHDPGRHVDGGAMHGWATC